MDNLNLKNDNSNGFRPETREELLALDLAEGLNDKKTLSEIRSDKDGSMALYLKIREIFGNYIHLL